MSAHWAMPDFDAMMPVNGGDLMLTLVSYVYCSVACQRSHSQSARACCQCQVADRNAYTST